LRYEPKPGIRRLLLQRTSYHLYFLVQADRVYVVAVWSAYHALEEVAHDGVGTDAMDAKRGGASTHLPTQDTRSLSGIHITSI